MRVGAHTDLSSPYTGGHITFTLPDMIGSWWSTTKAVYTLLTVRCLLGQGTEQTRTGGLHTLYSLLHQDEVHPWFHHFHHCPYPWLSRRNRQIHFPLRPQRYA